MIKTFDTFTHSLLKRISLSNLSSFFSQYRATFRPIITVLLAIFIIPAFGQIQVSLLPPIPTVTTPCTATPIYLSVKNAYGTSQSFAVTLNPGEDEVIDTTGFVIPSGFSDSLITNPSTGVKSIKVYTIAPLAAGLTRTITFLIRGQGCVSNADAYTFYDTINVTNVNGSAFSGSYTIGSVSNTYLILPLTNATANLTPITSTVTGVTTTIAPGGSSSIRVRYLNSGPVSYSGSLSIDGAFPCLDPNNLIINSVKLYVRDTVVPVATISGPVTTFPIQFCNIHIDSNTIFIIEENVSLSTNSCMGSSGCSALLDLKWGCSTSCSATPTPPYCHNNDSTPIPVKVLSNPVPSQLSVYRILPVPKGPGQNFAWENVCHGKDTLSSEDKWEFIVQNTGSAPADSVTFDLYPYYFSNGGKPSNTMIRKNSVRTNFVDTSLDILSALSGVSTNITTYQTADFAGVNPLSCYKDIRDTLYPVDTPIKRMTCLIPLLNPGEKMAISFKTYRCCAYDNTPNQGVYYNDWQLNVTGLTPCHGVISVPNHNLNVIFPKNSPQIVDTPHSIYGYPIWDTYIDAYRPISLNFTHYKVGHPNLALTQDFAPEATDLSAPTGACGDTAYYHIRNIHFNSDDNGLDDFDAMLYSVVDTFGGTGTGTPADGSYIPGLVGMRFQQHAQFIVDIDNAGANLHVPGNVSMTGVLYGTAYVWPATSTTVIGNVTRAIFDLSTLNSIVPLHTTYDLREFVVSSYINFGFYMCCSNPVPNPIIKVTTSFNAQSDSCPGCVIPLSQVTKQLFLHCPGCVDPGIIADKFSFRRLNYGLSDANNDQRPDNNVVITPSYSQFGLVSVNSSIVGDTLQAITSGYMKDGDSTAISQGGFTLLQWRNAVGNDTLFTDFYLEQNITGADTVGLTCLGATVQFYHAGTLVSTTPVTPTVISGKKFIYHITKSNFNAKLVEGDRFTVSAIYRTCTNPTQTTALPVVNTMYVTRGALSLATDPLSADLNPSTFIGNNDPGAYGLPAAQYILAHQGSTPVLFYCEAFGGLHRVFPLKTTYSETWNDANGCSSKGLTITLLNQITDLSIGNNLFPFECRLIPSIYPTTFGRGPVLSNNDPLHFAVLPNLTGYTITPTSVSTFAPYTYDPLHPGITTTTVTQRGAGNDSIIRPTGSTTDWMVNISKVEFTPFYASLPSTNIIDPGNHDPYLVYGDELFSQTMTFSLATTCASVQKIDSLSKKEAYVTVPGGFNSCAGSDYKVGDTINTIPNTTVTQNLTVLHSPNANLTAKVNPTGYNYPHTNGSNIDNLILMGSNFATYVPNLYFYIKVSTSSGSTLPAGISVGAFDAEYPNGSYRPIPPHVFTVGADTYYGYSIPNDSVNLDLLTSKRYHLIFIDSQCYSLPPQLAFPIHYSWSCDSFPTGLPSQTTCSRDTFVNVSYKLPIVNLFSQISAPTTYSTCTPIKITAELLNQEIGGAGHFVAHLTLPNGFTIPGSGDTLTIVPPTGSPHRAVITSSHITHITDVDTSKQDWTIYIDSLTEFASTSLVGTTGLYNAGGPIYMTFPIIANCNAHPSDTLSFTLTMNGWRFCNLVNFNPAVPGDINDTFPRVVILPAAGSAFNGCGPYLAGASTNESCFGGSTATITVTPTVSSFYGATPIYTYTWSPTEPNSGSLSGLSANIYSLTVTDTVKHCMAVFKDTITQPTILVDSITKINATIGGCTNGSATVYPYGGTPGYTFHWSNAQTAATATGLSGGNTYKVTITDSKGCTKIDSVVMPIVAPPVITGISFICSGSSTTLDAGPGYDSYTWSTTANTEQISVSAAGTYIVTVTKGVCTATASFVLSLNPLPDPTATITGYRLCTNDSSITSDKGNVPFTLDQSKPCTQVCEGSTSRITVTLSNATDSAILTVVGGTKSFNAGLSNSTVKVWDITWGTQGQGSITVEEWHVGGCSVFKNFCIDILPNATAKIGILGITGTDVCVNNSVIFQDQSSIDSTLNGVYANISGWHWDFGDGTGSNVQNPSHIFTSTGTYTVTLTVTSPCNCTSTTTLKVTVDDATAIDIQCPTPICYKGSATYTVTGCSNVTWTCIGGTITSHTSTSVSITWDGSLPSGFGYVSATPVSCSACKLPATVKIPIITHNVPILGPSTICALNNTYYSIPTWPGGRYTWSVANGSPSPSASIIAFNNESQVLVRATSYGTFTLKVLYTDSVVGCIDSSLILVHVVNKIVDSASPAKGCVGTTAHFTLSGGATSPFVIVDPNGVPTSFPSANSITYTPLIAGDYTVDVTSAGVCIDTPLIYHVDLVPHVYDSLISGANQVCRNLPYTYTADSPAAPNTQYVWTIPNTGDGSFVGTNIGNSVIVKWTNSGFAHVCQLAIAAQSLTSLSCMDTSTKRYNVTIIEPNPAFAIPTTVCANSLVSVAHPVSTQEEYYSWTFTPSNLASCFPGDEHVVNPRMQFNNVTVPTPVTIRLTVNRCNQSSFKDSAITIMPNSTVALPAHSSGCSNNTVTFSATPSAIDPGATYNWFFGDGSNTNSGTSNTVTHTFAQSGTYYVHVVTTFTIACGGIATSNIDTVTIIQTASVTLNSGYSGPCVTGTPISVPLSITPSTYASTAVWTDNGTVISAAAGQSSYTATSLGAYLVTVIDANGCTATSNAINLQLCPPNGGSCPLSINNGPVTISCDDIISATANYSIPFGYSFNTDSWYLDAYSGTYYVPGSGSNTGNHLNTGAYSFQVNHSGTFYILTYSLTLNAPNGGTTNCTTVFYITVPLHMDYKANLQCNGTNSGYTAHLSDNSDYVGTTPTYQWSFSPSITGSPFSGTNITTGNLTAGTTYTVSYTVTKSDMAAAPCTKTFNLTVPATTPNASFDYIDTPLTPSADRSSVCQNFSILLQPTASQNSAWHYRWVTGDGGSIIAYNPPKQYGSPASGLGIVLTVTDDYGCSATFSRTVTNVVQNRILGGVGPTSGTPHLTGQENAYYFCPSGGSFTFDYEVTLGGAPTHWRWYNSNVPNTTLSTASTYTSSGPDGRYMCSVSDDNGCQATSLPGGSLHTMPIPPLSIIGKRVYCVGDTVRLTTQSLPNIKYDWSIGATHYTGGATWVIPSLIAGADTVHLTYTDTFANTGSPLLTCSASADPFIFSVYSLPTVSASIDTNSISCNPYEISLNASGTGIASYAWSNGSTSSSTTVYAGGDYRIIVYGGGNCKNFADIRVPEDPEVLLQYVPYGCFSLNCDNLNSVGLSLNGPPNTLFRYWAWNAEGTPVSGHTGGNSAVVPYVVHYTGDYSLTINNGLDLSDSLCSNTSPIMHVSGSNLPCGGKCGMKPKVTVSDCSGSGEFPMTITVNNSHAGATYNLTSPSGTFTGTTPSTLASGSNTIHTTFNANVGVTGTIMIVITEIYSGGTCQDTTFVKLPTCTKSARVTSDVVMYIQDVQMKLMPNPASNSVTIVYSTDASNDPVPVGEVLTLTLGDVTGKLITEMELEALSGMVTIDISSLASGTYYVTMRKNGRPIITDKLITISK